MILNMRLRNQMIAVAAFAVAVAIGAGLNSGKMTAEDGQGHNKSSVTVVNPPSSPVKTSSVDDPGRIPYQFFKNLQPCSGSVCQATTPAVPAGKRLVVQHVSAFGALTSPGNFVEVVVSTPTAVLSTFAPPVFGNPGAQGFAFDQLVQGYADAGSAVTVFISANGSLNQTASDFIVTGYLIDCQANLCAPIAP